jgi:asparagine synthase (glutamine-hydrolysing)
VARREGLPNPLPVTNRFPGVAETDETQWQERVIRHLELDDWLRLEWDDELDVLGPIATKVLRRHGILFPWNSFFHYPLLECAEGGSLLTGIGGDELFKQVPRRLAARLLYEHRLPRPRQVPRLAFELSPRPIRRAVDAWRDDYFDLLHWIRAPQRRALERASSDWLSRNSLRNDRALDLWWRCRMLQCGRASLDALARDFDTLIAHPLADPGLLEALARTGGKVGTGPGSRKRGVKHLVGDLLPRETLDRDYKTGFDGAFWKGPARAFASEWDGSGLDAEQVDVEALSAEWSKAKPLPMTFIQLHRAWLGNAAGG